MGFLSQEGHVGIKTQASKGSYLDPGASDPNHGVFMRLRSGALGGNRELLIPDPEIGGNRDVPDAQLGPINFVGEWDFYARMDALGVLLTSALGDDDLTVDTPEAGANEHVITPTATLPWLSVEEKIANGYEAFEYTDCKINTLHLEAEAQGYVTGTCGVVGLTQAIEASPTAAGTNVDTSPLLVGTNVNVLWNAVALPAKSFSIDINNNLEDDDFRLGSLFLGDIVEKRREITMSVTIRPEDGVLWRTAMWGDPAAVAPGGQSYKDDVSIVISSYEDIGATSTVYSATFTIPSAIIQPFELDPSGDDVLEHDIEIQLVRPDPTVDIMSVTVINELDVVA